MKIGVVSLGCPKNQVDAEIMLGIIEKMDWTITNNPEEADLIIVNTCGFIESAKEESVNTVLQMAEYKIRGTCKHLLMTGCLGQRYASELFEDIPELDAILGTECYTEIGKVIERVLKGERLIVLEPFGEEFAEVPDVTRKLTTPSHYAYLKIAEGCDNCCSYCIIPKLRGPYRSRPFEAIMKEAAALAASGVKELVIVAQDTTRYGEELYGKLRLAELLRELNKLEGLHWIRVLYCYPQYFTDDLIDAFAECDKVCKYVDLPLQHISDRILTRMNRPDTREQIEALIKKLRQRVSGIAVRTTFIVGFPGESEADFEELMGFVAGTKFDCAGVFTYSCEEGTAAALMPDQISEQTKQERYHALMSLQAEISEGINQELEDGIMLVLFEGFEDGDKNIAYGRSYREAPEIDGRIFIENAGNVRPGDFLNVIILQGFTYELLSEPV